MIEKIILDYLNTALNVPCYMETPKNPPVKYVLIEKTGSGNLNHINNATFAIQSYADSLYNTAQLNADVIKAMIGDGVTSFGIAYETDDISRCDLDTDYNYTDTAKKQYRYQAVFDLTY